MPSTAERWREEIEDGRRDDEPFHAAVKAWQGLTHPISSPTWRNHEWDLDEDDRDEVGYLRPNETVRDAWRETRARALALEAEVVVLQTPPSFDATDEHEANVRELLDGIDRAGLTLAWEPRADWSVEPDRVRVICEDLDLVHVTDAMRREPLTSGEVAYTRLHGLNDDPYEYDYDYSDAELEELGATLKGLKADRGQVFCLFNNYEMYENAARLREILDAER